MSAIADVNDLDCVLAFAPLRLGLSAKHVRAHSALLRRVLYRWCVRRGRIPWAPAMGLDTPILSLPGSVFSQRDVLGLRLALRREAMAVSFVSDAAPFATLGTSGLLSLGATIAFEDGREQVLSVDVSGAAAALQQIGGAT